MSNEERKNLHEVADSELEAAGGLKDGKRKVITLVSTCGGFLFFFYSHFSHNKAV